MTVKHKCGFKLDQQTEKYMNKVGECTGVFWYHLNEKVYRCPKCDRKLFKAEFMPKVKRVFGLPDEGLAENNFDNLNIVK